MPYSTYRALPLEGLYELLFSSVRDMLVLEDQETNAAAYKAIKNQVRIIMELIEEKQKERKN
jgi:hypothetical protein